MIITAWIMLIAFGAFAVNGFLKFAGGTGLIPIHLVMWFVSIIIFALSAGVIWGGLLG